MLDVLRTYFEFPSILQIYFYFLGAHVSRCYVFNYYNGGSQHRSYTNYCSIYELWMGCVLDIR